MPAAATTPTSGRCVDRNERQQPRQQRATGRRARPAIPPPAPSRAAPGSRPTGSAREVGRAPRRPGSRDRAASRQCRRAARRLRQQGRSCPRGRRGRRRAGAPSRREWSGEGRTSANQTRNRPSAWSGTTTSPSLIELITSLLPAVLPIGGRRLHDISARALSDPQRLEREARLKLAVDAQKQGHAADDAVVVRQPVEKAKPGHVVGEFWDRNKDTVEIVDEIGRRIADEGKAGLRS